MAEKKKRIASLEKELRRHRQLYYKEQPEISDAEFDELVDELEKLAPDSEVLAEVGAPVDLDQAGLPTKEHRIPMGSLDKVTEDKLELWVEKAGPLFLIQEKYDGISLELEYRDGRLVDAITRGDGFTGEVVTHNAAHFANISGELPVAFTGSVRGEVILRLSAFEEHFRQKDFANPRNTVSGTVRKKHGDRSLNRHFELFFYDVLSVDREFETEKEKMAYLGEELGLPVAVSYFDQTMEGLLEIYRLYEGDEEGEGKRFELDYEIDGLVVRSDSIALQQKLGSRQNKPRYAMAYKFPSSGSATKLLAVDWSLGLGSRITPVARLEPVQIAGVMVSNPTQHKVDANPELDLRIGDTVFVERRGDVIPKVIRVLEPGSGEKPEPPASCPSCRRPLCMDGKFLICPSDECPGKTYGDILKWINSLEIDSLGEKWVSTLIEAKLLEDPADLYALSIEALVPLDRMGETLAAKIVQNIGDSRAPALERFIAALNIPGFSRQRARMLIDEGVITLAQLLEMPAEEISAVKGFADISSEGIVAGLQKKSPLIEKLRNLGVEPRQGEPAEEVDGVLNGKTFCFTGAIQRIDPLTEKRLTRKQLEEMVKANGGRSLKDVTSKLNHLVMANPDSKSSKAKKARGLEVNILSEEEFFALLET
ncbi:MAG: NAD-dependent DNA ligase LigA [Planctomycetota bacterium]|nr:NAD-dependent DNA ligase LigA [Planctomycetota bacterium]